ncbi:MAG: hypothetical protein ABIN25_09595, partial [Ginsengibacter sp.]
MIKGLFTLLAVICCQLSIGQQTFSDSLDLAGQKDFTAVLDSKKILPVSTPAYRYKTGGMDKAIKSYRLKRREPDVAAVSPYTTGFLKDGLAIT